MLDILNWFVEHTPDDSKAQELFCRAYQAWGRFTFRKGWWK